jgi:hypothetical protein
VIATTKDATHQQQHQQQDSSTMLSISMCLKRNAGVEIVIPKVLALHLLRDLESIRERLEATAEAASQ